jgi:hypothetical protein
MPYENGQRPEIGDRVQHNSGYVGTVDSVQLNAGKIWGQDQITVDWDDGSSFTCSAEECILIYRTRTPQD